jgi:glycolate oxidase FAD binding subunit
MTYEIAEKLEMLVSSDADFVAWENVESVWKEKIENAIATQTPPDCLIFPRTSQALAKIVKYASDRRLSILPCGSGSKLNWGGLVKDARLVVSTQRLDRIIEHAVGDLTVTVEAGVKLSELQAILAQSHQFLPLDPVYPDSATLGGIVATADAGSWRHRYGGIRDMVLGLSFVRADGEIAKAGGRVVKNVAGYDLMKLFTGSYGTLGIISQVTFRLYPAPATSGTIALSGEASAIATATQTLLMSSLAPTAAEVISSALVESLKVGKPNNKQMGLILRFQSIAESVQEQIKQVESIAQKLDLKISIYSDRDELDLWKQWQDLRHPQTQAAVTCKIGVLPNAAVKILEKCNSDLATINLSSGLGKLQFKTGEINPIQEMRSLCQSHNGFLSVLEAAIALKEKIEPWGYVGNSLPMMQAIAQKFDPNNIFSPGRFFNK